MKEAAYKGLVRPVLEYGSSVWDPHTHGLQEELGKVQNRTARFVSGNYVFETGSMTGILGQLKWESLKKRRKDSRLILLYKGLKVQCQLLELIKDHYLSQVVKIPTRNDRTLDLLFTNSPSPVNRVKGMPPIGKADHDIIYVEYDIKAKRIQQAPRKIYLYKRADMEGLRDHLAQFRDSFLSSDHSHMSVNDMWVSFKSEVLVAIERFIPTKMTKTKYSLNPPVTLCY